jgi:hypothetical protein
MTSMCCSCLRSLLDLLKSMLHLVTMRAIATLVHQRLQPFWWHLSKVVDICEDNQQSSRSDEVSLCFEAGQLQEGYVKRAFGVLNLDLLLSSLTWSREHIWELMHACVIMHNMIIESESISLALGSSCRC